jgi:hypothetical protein
MTMISVRMDDDEVAHLDSIRGVLTRSEAIRALVMASDSIRSDDCTRYIIESKTGERTLIR